VVWVTGLVGASSVVCPVCAAPVAGGSARRVRHLSKQHAQIMVDGINLFMQKRTVTTP
jgi:hypothetical protein